MHPELRDRHRRWLVDAGRRRSGLCPGPSRRGVLTMYRRSLRLIISNDILWPGERDRNYVGKKNPARETEEKEGKRERERHTRVRVAAEWAGGSLAAFYNNGPESQSGQSQAPNGRPIRWPPAPSSMTTNDTATLHEG